MPPTGDLHNISTLDLMILEVFSNLNDSTILHVRGSSSL